MTLRLIIFLIINFGALALGGYFTGAGVPSDWYQNLAIAPWTTPGWFFGVAWTTIMICFSIYLAYLWPLVSSKKNLIILFTLQWVFNVAWNPAFFYFHNIVAGLIILLVLILLVGSFFFKYKQTLKLKSILILPYLIWAIVASSLNAYILVNY